MKEKVGGTEVFRISLLEKVGEKRKKSNALTKRKRIIEI